MSTTRSGLNHSLCPVAFAAPTASSASAHIWLECQAMIGVSCKAVFAVPHRSATIKILPAR